MNPLRILARNYVRPRKTVATPPLPSLVFRSFSQVSSSPESNRPSFGIAFDIDGVVLLGHNPVGGSHRAIKRLYDCAGGGFPESKRASELSELLGVNISPSQVLQGHSPFRTLVNRFENELIVAVGKGDPAAVMYDYGFNNVVSMDEYASCFENIDPLSQYKKWAIKLQSDHEDSRLKKMHLRDEIIDQRVQAAFVVSDPVDWSRDIQVLCDILRTGGLPGREIGSQPCLYFANDDLDYQATFPTERLGMGAFRIALESIFNRIHSTAIEYKSFGKPKPFVFKNAEDTLKQLVSSVHFEQRGTDTSNSGSPNFKTLYMVGDNPKIDIRGARQAGHPWFSILTRTGVFKGKDNHADFPADLVVDTVEEAVAYILKKELS